MENDSTRKWEFCDPGIVRGRWHRPQATMDRRGVIKLNRVAWEMLGCSDYCNLMYDSENQIIGIKPLRAELRGSFPLEPAGKHGSRIVRAHSLNTQFQVPQTQTLRFVSPLIDPEGILTLDLPSARPAHHGGRVGAFYRERKEKLDPRPPTTGE